MLSKKRNKLPNVTDADIINSLTCRTTYEALINTLRHEAPQMMQSCWTLRRRSRGLAHSTVGRSGTSSRIVE